MHQHILGNAMDGLANSVNAATDWNDGYLNPNGGAPHGDKKIYKY